MFAQVQGLFQETLNLQWQIQDFWNSNARGGANLLFAMHFAKNCVNMNKVDREGARIPRSATDLHDHRWWLSFLDLLSQEHGSVRPNSPAPEKNLNERSKDRQAEHTTNCTVVLISRVSFATRTGEATDIEASASEDIYLCCFFLDICLFSWSLLQWVCIL